MHKIVAFILSALIGVFSSPTYTQVVERASSSVVRITGDKDMLTNDGPMHGSYVCTGEVIAQNRVLTAAHCLGDNMTADGQPAKMMKADHLTDLMILEVKTGIKPILAMRDEPVVRFELLSGIGYAWGLTRLSVMAERVFLTGVTPPDDNSPAPKILVQPGYAGGMSGGPVVDKDGLMVGIVQESGDSIGLGVSVLQIHAFLEGVQ